MDKECKEYGAEDRRKEVILPGRKQTGVWETELEEFRRRLTPKTEVSENCTQCSESIVSWSGKHLLCARKGIIVRSLE